jgi:hypothetical protein
MYVIVEDRPDQPPFVSTHGIGHVDSFKKLEYDQSL